MILSGSAVQVNGLGSLFVSATKRLMVAWRSITHRKTPRFSRRLASLAKNPSTASRRASIDRRGRRTDQTARNISAISVRMTGMTVAAGVAPWEAKSGHPKPTVPQIQPWRVPLLGCLTTNQALPPLSTMQSSDEDVLPQIVVVISSRSTQFVRFPYPRRGILLVGRTGYAKIQFSSMRVSIATTTLRISRARAAARADRGA
jgi:hypothetical protein